MKNEQQNPETMLHTVKQVEYVGHEFHIYAGSFKEADEWFAKNLRTGNGDFKDMEHEIQSDNAVYLNKVVDIKSEKPLVYVGEKSPLADKVMQGYDFESGCYVFSKIDTYTSQLEVGADTPEEAIKKVMDGEVKLKEGAVISINCEVFACCEDERVIVDGSVVKYHDEDELTKRLQQEFPDGLTVTLENESLRNLLDYRQVDEDGEWIELNGMVSDKGMMPAAYGNLEAKLKLKPEDYGLIYACEKTYWSNELSEIGWDAEVNSTSMLLAFEDSMKDIRVQAGVSEEILKHLMIEDRPYKEVMELVDRYGIKDEDVLVHYFNTEFLNKQPEWKIKLAEQETKEVVNKFFVNKAQPAFTELKKMFKETQEQAAKENGYASAADWNKDIGWFKNPSPQMTERMQKTSERWRELYIPYEKKCNEVFDQLERLKANEQREYIKRFDRRASQAVSNVKIIQRGVGDLAIRCMIDGQQQMGRTLNKEHVRTIMDAPSRNMKEMAVQYFKDEIAASMQQSRQQGLKR